MVTNAQKKVILTKELVIAVYDEIDRRIEFDIENGDLPLNKPKWIDEERRSMIQGAYGTMMAIVPNKNWQDIVWWCDEIERERYGEGWKDRK